VALQLTRTAGGADVTEYNRTRNNLSVLPNPFDSELQVHFTLAQGQYVTLHVHDVEGHTVYNSTSFYESGEHKLTLNLQVPVGNYCVNLRGETVNLTSLVIKK